jgi:hypothetical protein
MRRTGRKAAPEVNDRRAVAERNHVDQLVLQRRVAVDGRVNGRMQGDDLIDAAHVVPEAVHEGRVLVEQRAEGGHVVVVPGALKREWRVFGSSHPDPPNM